MAHYVVWHTISRSEQKTRASEHSDKQMHTSWLALSHWMTSIASNGPIIYLKYMATPQVKQGWKSPRTRHCQRAAKAWGSSHDRHAAGVLQPTLAIRDSTSRARSNS